jgi:hypothetical protein
MLRVVFLSVLIVACTDPGRPSGGQGDSSVAGVGSDAAGRGGSEAIGHGTGGSGARDAPCTPNLPSDDEFYVPCEDGGRSGITDDASAPAEGDGSTPDAGDQPEPDAGGDQPEPDAGPEPTDEGPCANRTGSCDVGQGQTSIPGASCTIDGNALRVQRSICEVCNKATVLVGFSLVVMPCGVCSQVYRESPFTEGDPLTAGECRLRSDAADLTWTQSDPYCIDIYAHAASGTSSGGGSFAQVHDEVRVCRCDRTTDTCVSCAGGGCEDGDLND